MFIQRMQIAAADSLRSWTDVLQDEGAPRAWMALRGMPQDVPAEAALRIARASRATGDGRRALLTEAFWMTYANVTPAPVVTRSRMIACGETAFTYAGPHFQTNCNQLLRASDVRWPIQPTQQSRIEGTHTGYVDELVFVWPWEPVDYANALTVVIPGSVIVLVEPGPDHVGWTGWAGFKSREFVDAVNSALLAQSMKLTLLSSQTGDVAVSYFGVEAK